MSRANMKPKIFVARPIPVEVAEFLAEHCEVRQWQGPGLCGFAEMKREIQDAEGLLTSGGRLDDNLFVHTPKLRVISTISVGYNNMDIEAMKARGMIGTHTPYVLDDSVADLVFGLMLASSRRIAELDRYVKEGKWQKGIDQALFGLDVHHAKLGIVGMGRIGQAIAKRAKFGFDMEVIYHNRKQSLEAEEKYGAVYRPLDELLQESDFVVVMVPLTPETERLIGAREFGLMKPTAVFINASRGQVVDEKALTEALQSRQIYAAGLDVFEKEPVDPANPLLAMDSVVALPHIGSATTKTRDAMAMLAAQNLVAALRGEEPPNVVPEFREE
jgi:glyoxylate/hydroxypyruvate/2-ketogluconate reductase